MPSLFTTIAKVAAIYAGTWLCPHRSGKLTPPLLDFWHPRPIADDAFIQQATVFIF